MAARPECVVVDAADPAALAGWWAAALAWTAEPEGMPGWWNAGPGPGAPGLPLLFGPVTDPKRGRNRVHLDLRSGSADDQERLAERLTGLGAPPVDIGQGEVPWVVPADPEGNELCVLPARAESAADQPGQHRPDQVQQQPPERAQGVGPRRTPSAGRRLRSGA